MKYLFTHTDLDGVGCAILAKLAFGEGVKITYCNYNDVDVIVSEFLDEVCLGYEEGDKVYITDISVSEEVAEKIDSSNARYYIRLMDHHKTAEWLNSYSWADVQTETVMLNETIKTSGTELFYKYLSDMAYISKGNKIIREFVNFVRDYDTWRWKGFENGTPIKEFNDLLYILGRDAFIERCMTRAKGNKHIVEFSKDERAALDKRQKEIDDYIELKGFQMSVNTIGLDRPYKAGVVFAEKYFSELGNKLCDAFDIDFVMMVDMGARVVHYRATDEEVDVSEIAKMFGGGGHKAAAGNTFDYDTRDRVIQSLLTYMRPSVDEPTIVEKFDTFVSNYDKALEAEKNNKKKFKLFKRKEK